ncbi:hypothetical protein DYB32_007680, partial [Aphanomyces invadans]
MYLHDRSTTHVKLVGGHSDGSDTITELNAEGSLPYGHTVEAGVAGCIEMAASTAAATIVSRANMMDTTTWVSVLGVHSCTDLTAKALSALTCLLATCFKRLPSERRESSSASGQLGHIVPHNVLEAFDNEAYVLTDHGHIFTKPTALQSPYTQRACTLSLVIARTPSHQLEHDQIQTHPGWCEHDADQIWSNVHECIAQTMKHVPGATVSAIGITNQRETSLLWDKVTGKPVYNALVWHDMRTADIVYELLEGHDINRFRAT